jgi:hypothetical protein
VQGEPLERYFAADEWQKLTSTERSKRCRLLAKEATQLAQSADPNLREAYQQLADQWIALACKIETNLFDK